MQPIARSATARDGARKFEDFAESRFWRALALALVAALFFLGWAVSGERTLLPVVQAGGVGTVPGSLAVYTTDESGSVLYVWNMGGTVERWSWEHGQAVRRAVYRLDQPVAVPVPGAAPGVPGGVILPPGQQQPPPQPGSPGSWDKGPQGGNR